ncbi:MAG: protein TolQ [Fibrobacterota bacterium]|jgi:biopolymer transport protein TolQ
MPLSESFPLIHLLLHMSVAGFLVMAFIVVLSVVSLGTLFLKWSQIRAVRQADRVMMNQLGQATCFEDISRAVSKGTPDGMRTVLRWGVAEAAIIPPNHPESALMIESAIESGIELERTRLEERMSLLVVTSSLGPFLGLLGTVWGIMDAFFAIGKMGSASLSVVAPGIAEALVTTLFGILVAIPAAAGHQLLSARIRSIESDWLVGGSRLLSLHRRTLG